MRKLGRILRRVLTALSLLLFVAVLAAWVRGYWSWDRVSVVRASSDDAGWGEIAWCIEVRDGQIDFMQFSYFAGSHQLRDSGVVPESGWSMYIRRFRVRSQGYPRSSSSFSWNHQAHRVTPTWRRPKDLDSYVSIHEIAFPCWMAAIVFGALPSWQGLAWWRAARRRRRASLAGRCVKCGYDLRASPLRCPECGTAVASTVAPAARP